MGNNIPSLVDAPGTAGAPPAPPTERQADRRHWATLVRQSELDAAVAALTQDSSLGVVITGSPGVGKSFLAGAVLSSLGPGVHTMRLRASSGPSGPSAPSTCLGPLLARLPKSAPSSGTGLLLALERMLADDAGGRDVVLTLDLVGPLAEDCVAVLMHLVLSRAARLMVIAPAVADLAPDLARLVRGGRIREVALGRIGVPETRRLVAAIVGGRVASSTIGEVHYACGGNPAEVYGIVHRERARGNLHQRGGVWTLDRSVRPEPVRGADDLIRARWARESQDVREVIEQLAVARRVPITALAGLFGSEVLVDMEDRGLIAVDASQHRCAYLREPRMAELVRARLGPDRHRELASLMSLGGASEDGGLDRDELISYVEWTLEVGTAPEPGLVLQSAAAAVELFEPDRALALLDRLPALDGPPAFEAAFRRAAALAMLERRDEALSVLEAVPPAVLGSLEAVDAARHAAATSELLCWLPEAGNALEPLRAAWDRLAVRAEESGPVRAAAEVLDLAEFRVRAFTGDFMPILARLESASRDTDGSEGFRRGCSLILAHAWAACGREMDAAGLVASIEFSAPRRTDEGDFLATAFSVWTATGDWKRCVDLFEEYMDKGGRRLTLRGGIAELYLALAHLAAGHGSAALGPVLSAAAQLEEFPALNALRAAYAAAALAYAQIGDSGEAERFLALAAKARGPMFWQLATCADQCEGAARTWLGQGDGAAAMLARAARDEAAGRMSAAGTAVFDASVVGGEREFLWIERLAHHRQGPLAHLYAAVASATRRRDVAALLAAAEEAYDLRLDAVEARCAALALDFARGEGNSVAAGLAQTRLDRLARVLPVLPLVPQTPAPMLTERERQIAVLAASGSSNRDIADELGVSVRTVEGHLYQVFMKLGVSSRAGLAGLV
jgi:DNA-binding NarL/FixJ family response regulator